MRMTIQMSVLRNTRPNQKSQLQDERNMRMQQILQGSCLDAIAIQTYRRRWVNISSGLGPKIPSNFRWLMIVPS